MTVPFSNGKNIYQSQIIAQNSADEIRQTKKMQKNTVCVRAPAIFVLGQKLNDMYFKTTLNHPKKYCIPLIK